MGRREEGAKKELNPDFTPQHSTVRSCLLGKCEENQTHEHMEHRKRHRCAAQGTLPFLPLGRVNPYFHLKTIGNTSQEKVPKSWEEDSATSSASKKKALNEKSDKGNISHS